MPCLQGGCIKDGVVVLVFAWKKNGSRMQSQSRFVYSLKPPLGGLVIFKYVCIILLY